MYTAYTGGLDDLSDSYSAVCIKGTVLRDFLPLVFFFRQLLLAPVDKPINDFNFFRIFAEIFDYFGASPVSLTPVNNSSPVSTTPLSDTFTVLESFTGVNDTGKNFLTGVIDTGKNFLTVVIDTGEAFIHQCQ
jgi:hypothetical protein